jgi:hypothetical protein
MSEISNGQIYDTLLGIKSDIGGLLATVQAHQQAFEKHLKDDAIVAADVTTIRLRLAKQAGSARTWGIIATGASALAGSIAGYFGMHRG